MSSQEIISHLRLEAGRNRGPITTRYSQPTSCLATLTLNPENTKNLFFVGHYVRTYVDLDCYPTGTLQAQELVTSDWNLYYYSPAFCPDAWITATAFEGTIRQWSEVVGGETTVSAVTVGSSTTAALCCPPGYSYWQNSEVSYYIGHQCTSLITQGQVFSYRLPNLGAGGYGPQLSVMSRATSETLVPMDGVPILWQSSDLSVFSQASAGPTTIALTSVTNTATKTPQVPSAASVPSNTSTATHDLQSSGSSGLSTGAKAGLGVGIPVAVIACLALGFLLFRRRRRSGESYAQSGAYHNSHDLPVFKK